MDKSDFTPKEWQKLFDEVREILVNQAALNQPISYGKLCAKISTRNMKPTDKALEEVLGEISESEDRRDRGMLSVFVGNKQKGYMPGDGFFEQARKLGRNINRWSNPAEKEMFVKKERERVHQTHRNPTIHTF